MKLEYKIEEFDAIDGFFALITEVNSHELVAKAYSSHRAREIVAALLASSQGQGDTHNAEMPKVIPIAMLEDAYRAGVDTIDNTFDAIGYDHARNAKRYGYDLDVNTRNYPVTPDSSTPSPEAMDIVFRIRRVDCMPSPILALTCTEAAALIEGYALKCAEAHPQPDRLREAIKKIEALPESWELTLFVDAYQHGYREAIGDAVSALATLAQSDKTYAGT